jgi:uncharacterized protein YciI
MNRSLFLVTRFHESAWDHSKPLEQQPEWQAHADYMDALADEGFIVLGGPIVGTDDVLLIIRASSPEEIEKRLADDVWTRRGLLTTREIHPWQLRLGRLPG